MTIVDTHCHAGETWFEPIEVLLHQMDANDVDKAVLVQHRGAFDNSYLLECASRFPGRFTAVAQVDTSKSDAPAALERWAAQGAVAVRLAPTARSPGADPLAIWRRASELGLVVSSIGAVEAFATEEFRDLVAGLPGLTVVIEHLADARRDTEPPHTVFQRALELARLPNTYLKVGGLGEISPRPPVHSNTSVFDYTPPLIEMAYEAFGAQRMMWGSDFPPVSHREGYRNAMRGVMDHPAFQSGDDREWVMGKTALEVFSFD